MDLGLSWRDNAIANKHIRILRNPLGDYKGFAKLWSKAKRTAKSQSYRTSRRHDQGPKEYRTAKQALNSGKDLVSSLEEVFESVTFSKKTLPELEGKINDFRGLRIDRSNTKEARGKAVEILECAKEVYEINFDVNVGVELYRPAVVAFSSIIGLLFGGAVGLGLSKVAGKIKIPSFKRMKRKTRDLKKDEDENRARDIIEKGEVVFREKESW